MYSIALLGAMNPAIHHPKWYEYIGVMDKAEVTAAVADPGLMVTPVFTVMRFPGFAIICQQNRWEVQAMSRDLSERLFAIAAGVFEALEHTPVTTFGFNTNQHRRTSSADVPRKLADAVMSADLGFDLAERVSAEIVVRSGTPERHSLVRIQPSTQGPDHVFVGVNFEYLVPVQQSIHFELTPLLQQHYRADQDEALATIQRIVDSLSK
jgi:hypothetical protein